MGMSYYYGRVMCAGPPTFTGPQHTAGLLGSSPRSANFVLPGGGRRVKTHSRGLVMVVVMVMVLVVNVGGSDRAAAVPSARPTTGDNAVVWIGGEGRAGGRTSEPGLRTERVAGIQPALSAREVEYPHPV